MNNLPVIPEHEFGERRRALQSRMGELDLDVLVINSNDRAVHGQGNIRYLTDFATHFEPACCLIPRGGEAVLVVGPESEALALVFARIEHIAVALEYTHPEEDYPWAKMVDFADIIQECADGQEIKRVGIIGMEFIDSAILTVLTNHYEVVDAEKFMDEARAVKSSAEINVLEYTYTIATEGLKAGIAAIKEGVTEYEVAAEIEYAMRKMGSEGAGIDTMVGSGADHSRPIIARTTFRKIQPNELVQLSIIPRYQGYHAAVGRPASIGNPSKEILRAGEAALKAQEAIIENVVVGKMGREVEHIGRAVMGEYDLEEYFTYIALHSVGIIEFEAPIFFSGCDSLIEENMVLSVDLPCFLAPWGGFRMEDGYRTTKRGPIALSDSVQRGLIIV